VIDEEVEHKVQQQLGKAVNRILHAGWDTALAMKRMRGSSANCVE